MIATTSISVKPEATPDWMMAKRGVQLLINNQAEEAVALFRTYPDSLPMFAGYAFAVFMDALMSLEDDKLNLALAILRETEQRCATETGWLKSIQKRMFGTETKKTLAESLETQIILADSQVCIALLTFLQQDLSGYFKGGWVLRKSWKVYQHTYREISRLFTQLGGEAREPDNTDCMSHTIEYEPISDEQTSADWDIPIEYAPTTASKPLITNGNPEDIDKETITRLMGAISFGYGLFQLGVSLLPQSLLKISSFLGFGGDKKNGIDCLMYARTSSDMRAPLATLALLWYHTIIRPFYALDGRNVQAGVNEAETLIKESLEYQNSALFLFFRGRVHRLKAEIPQALAAFQESVQNASQREIKVLSMHEVAWCHLIQLDYEDAEKSFQQLKVMSRWSRTFYAYLAAVCAGAGGKLKDLTPVREMGVLFQEHPKGSQLEEFLGRRNRLFPTTEEKLLATDDVYWKLMIYELMYLWNTLPTCSTDNVHLILWDCALAIRDPSKEPMLGLARLIEGSCFCIVKMQDKGVSSFRETIRLRKDTSKTADDAHISAFAHYELGSLLIKNPETLEEGKALLMEVSTYSGFDFETRLNVRVSSLLKMI